jgi:hypothetical protein
MFVVYVLRSDTSRVALALARQRLMTATFPYYKLAHPEKGVAGGFVYKTVLHITLRSIAQNEPPEQEILYDQPEIDKSKVRVSGPFTVEAIPVPAMESPPESPIPQLEVDAGNAARTKFVRDEGRERPPKPKGPGPQRGPKRGVAPALLTYLPASTFGVFSSHISLVCRGLAFRRNREPSRESCREPTYGRLSDESRDRSLSSLRGGKLSPGKP